MDREYDIFERLPDGKVLWHEVNRGHERAVERLKQLAAASQSKNEFFAIHVPTKAIIAVINAKKP
jgi:hypothetical protein